MKPQYNLCNHVSVNKLPAEICSRCELAASQLRTEQTEYDVKLKSTVTASEAANVLKTPNTKCTCSTSQK